MAVVFARRMENLRASEIRELLKVTEQPGIISFAGGMPAPELFQLEKIKQAGNRMLEEAGPAALQYATTEGYIPLRRKIAQRMNDRFATSVTYEDILITNGSQQGLDFAGKVFLNEGDVMLCESPTYLGALNAFKAYMPRLVEIPTDDGGMIIDRLVGMLETTENIKAIYVNPDFQNPTGKTWTTERRKSFMEVINRYEIPVIEDNPYGELRFEGEIPPSLKSMDDKGLVIYLGTFSKIMCPGLRIGWVAAEKSILEKYILVKQGTDLHTSISSQRKIDCYLDMYDMDEDIENIIGVYRKRRDAMIRAIREEFPRNVKYTNPEGGLFIWVELQPDVNARQVLEMAAAKGVVFVPGGSFFPNGGMENTMRLNYSNSSEDTIRKGMAILGQILKTMN